MDGIYRKFLKSGLDLVALGVERRADNAPYFCTPKGAIILGWAGVDGVHFCFIRGFGTQIFAVSPANGPGEYVHPIAADFADFLRLLLACGDSAALEQAWMWNEGKFDAFLRENPPSPEQRSVLKQISETLDLTPMEQPWEYLRYQRERFNARKIRFSEEYYEVTGESKPISRPWKVYFEGKAKGKRAGKPLDLKAEFDWAGRHWLVPTAYLCVEGLVLDVLEKIPEGDAQELYFHSELTVNGEKMFFSSGSGMAFSAHLPEETGNDPEAGQMLEHYGQDLDSDWFLSRFEFPWRGQRPKAIESLSLTMIQEPGQVPGPQFQVSQSGETVQFTNSVTGTEYVLTVQKLEQETWEPEERMAKRCFWPTHFLRMDYTLTPEPGQDVFLRDSGEGDRAMEISVGGDGDSALGIIGGADGPTAIFIGSGRKSDFRSACSAVHFAPVEEVVWQVFFRAKTHENGVFQLI